MANFFESRKLIKKNNEENDVGLSQNIILSKYLIFIIISSLGFGFLFSIFTKIDEVVLALGELQSPGAEKLVKSPFSSLVELVNVKEGQEVKKGQLLISLKTDKLTTKKNEINAKLKSLKETLKLKNEIVDKLKYLNEEGAISELEYLNQKDELQKIENQIVQTSENLQEINILKAEHMILSPINGSVFELATSGSGYFVSKGEPLLKIIPNESLEAKVYVRNRDIGFIKKNMLSEVRIDAYPFSNFGHITGTVKLIGNDSLPPDQFNSQSRFPVYLNLNKQYLEKMVKNMNSNQGKA